MKLYKHTYNLLKKIQNSNQTILKMSKHRCEIPQKLHGNIYFTLKKTHKIS